MSTINISKFEQTQETKRNWEPKKKTWKLESNQPR